MIHVVVYSETVVNTKRTGCRLTVYFYQSKKYVAKFNVDKCLFVTCLNQNMIKKVVALPMMFS